MREGTVFENRRHRKTLWQCCVPFVVEQMREKLPDIIRRVEMPRHAFRTPADGECETVEVRHDAEHRFIGDVIADEERATSSERLMRHQFEHAGRLGETGMLDLANALAGQHLDRRVRQSARISDTAAWIAFSARRRR